jgi:transposase
MTMPTLTRRAQNDAMGETDPPDRPTRRKFSDDYKLAILAEYDRLSDAGAKGSLLRREGLYSSNITEWRKARETGGLHRSGTPAPKPAKNETKEVERLRRRAERAEAELAKTKAALDIMGKAHALLEMLAESADPETNAKKS